MRNAPGSEQSVFCAPIMPALAQKTGMDRCLLCFCRMSTHHSALDVLAVRKGLAQLSPLDRAVLLLADCEGYSMNEVAEALGRTRVAVKLRASRARRRLARILGSDPGAGRSARGRDHEAG